MASAGPGGGGSATTGPPCSPTVGVGGALNANQFGGSGAIGTSTSPGGGGGGAAVGPAIFVNSGSLTTVNSGAASCAATAGIGGSSGTYSGSAGTADATPVFNYSGTVNGVTVTAGTGGPVTIALPATSPQ